MIIQVKAIHKEDGSALVWIGTVLSVHDTHLVMDHMPDFPYRYHVDKWRAKKPKGLAILQDILREVERADELV